MGGISEGIWGHHGRVRPAITAGPQGGEASGTAAVKARPRTAGRAGGAACEDAIPGVHPSVPMRWRIAADSAGAGFIIRVPAFARPARTR